MGAYAILQADEVQLMPGPKEHDQEYIENLTREVYFDTVRGFLKISDVSPIIAGAQDYLRLRRRFITWRNHIHGKFLAFLNQLRTVLKRRILMVNGQIITAAKIIDNFAAQGYVCDYAIADAVYLSMLLQ